MNLSKYEKMKTKERTDSEPDAILMERLEPKVKLQHFNVGPFSSNCCELSNHSKVFWIGKR